MQVIDCSFGEGGGQIIRTALALAALTGQDIQLKNIRAKRPKPGLMPQHLASVKALAAICDADIKGAFAGSRELLFRPKRIRDSSIYANISTAGSITLLIQQLMPASLAAKVKLRASGGTDVSFAPSANYLQKITIWFLKKMGAKLSSEIFSRGYFPKGNGSMVYTSEPSLPLKPIVLTSRSKLVSIEAFAHCAGMPTKVAQDLMLYTKRRIQEMMGDFDFAEKIETKPETKETKGLGIDLFANYRNCRIGVGLSSFKDISPEAIANRAAKEFMFEINSLAPLDSHMTDQIIPFMALANGKSTVCGLLTEHTKTNIEVTEKLLPVKFEIVEKGALSQISVDGVSFTL